jgi:hypothetical protein
MERSLHRFHRPELCGTKDVVSRSSKRSRVRIPLTARIGTNGQRSFVCRTRDVSEHGLLLETPEALATGTPMTLSLLDPASGAPIELDAVVARAVPPGAAGLALLGVKLVEPPATWAAYVRQIASAQSEGRTTTERPARRLRVLVVADEVARRGAVALYVTSGWDVRFASDLPSTEEALRGIHIDAVIAEHDLDDGRWTRVLEAAQRAQPHARRIVRSALHGRLPPPPGRAEDLVHRVVDLGAGLEAVLDALAADWGT